MSYCLHLSPMSALNKSLARDHHDWHIRSKVHSGAKEQAPLATCGGKILRWPLRFPAAGEHILYNLLSLSVGGTCDYDRIVTPFIRLCYRANSDYVTLYKTLL